MSFVTDSANEALLPKLRKAFRSRELFIHDGAAMRRIHISSRAQIMAFSSVVAVTAVSCIGMGQLVVGAAQATIDGVVVAQSDSQDMATKVAKLENQVKSIKSAAQKYAERLDARQTVLTAMLTGEATEDQLSAMLPAKAEAVDPAASDVVAMFSAVDAKQHDLADKVRQIAEVRYQATARLVTKLGISTDRMHNDSMTGVGGPYEPIAPQAKPAMPAAKADPQFRALFNSWRQLDQLNKGIVAIPSAQPVDKMVFTSTFGVRSDPFRGGRAMHAGVDIPGAYASPIYATADGVVGRTGWIGGYGNLVELEHGKGIQTRYGHLSSIVVAPGTRVKRGQLIALMGSTGRSTGNHLHYEVRIDGLAVNPRPFIQSNDYLVSLQTRANGTVLAQPTESASAK
jgi:murein DD-endopeptidase MepM/ murein hydrolase activator NlpD